MLGATLWGTGGANNSDLYRINPVTADVTLGYSLPNAPSPAGQNPYVYQAVAHYRKNGDQDRFFMTSYSAGSVANQVSRYNAQDFSLNLHLFDGASNALSTSTLNSISGYNSSWFNRGSSGSVASSLPWLNSGAGYFGNSVYMTAEYLTNVGGGNLGFYTYPFLLKLDLNASGNGFSSISKIDVAASGLPTDPLGRSTFGDVGDIDFVERGSTVGQFLLGGTIYNGGSGNTLDIERVSYFGDISSLGNGSVGITVGAANASPWGFDGVAELDGTFYGTAAAGNPSNEPRLYELDSDGNIVSLQATNPDTANGLPSFLVLNDLTSSYEVVPEPSSTFFIAVCMLGVFSRRRR